MTKDLKHPAAGPPGGDPRDCLAMDPRRFETLIAIMAALRSENGCPWDKAQTHLSLTRYLLEECYEVLDAIEKGDRDNLIEELGDVLFQVAFHAQIGRESETFDIGDVLSRINRKMVRRHPHVFGDARAEAVDWEALKRDEKQTATLSAELDRIPRTFTALMQAEKLLAKADKAGFDGEAPAPALANVRAESDGAAEALDLADRAHLEEALGDLLLAAVNAVRLCGFQPELVLRKRNAEFAGRLKQMEASAARRGNKLRDAAELDPEKPRRLAEEDRGFEER
jgi:tetrapyrrole methylase family protein/MazG family protein